eukprot:5592728-Ditylum_brightwellii.AAC.1
MDEFLESKLIPENIMKPLNYRRYFVEATTLVDIVTSDGKKIRTELFDPENFQKEEGKKHRLAQGTWPRHIEPDKSVKKLWKDALMKTVCNEQGVLHLPLGEWHGINTIWTYRYDRKHGYIYENEKWIQLKVKKFMRMTIQYKKQERKKNPQTSVCQ